MAKPSKIDKLPADIRGQIADLRGQGFTIDDILTHLRKMGGEAADISRSGLGRHIKGLDQIADVLHHSRGIAAGLAERMGEDGDGGKAQRLNTELLHAATTRLVLSQMDETGINLSAKEVAFLAGAMAKLSSAAKSDVDRTINVRKLLKAQIDEKLADAEKLIKDPKSDGAEMLRKVRQQIYGIFDE
jgi:hypothetical protein